MKNNRTNYKVLPFLILILIPVLVKSQVLFERRYPTNYDKTAREVLPTSDGGYLIAGITNNSNFYDCDAYVIKTDGNGFLQWEKIFGGSKPDYPYSMVETSDGNF